jgi:hypothetical protein
VYVKDIEVALFEILEEPQEGLHPPVSRSQHFSCDPSLFECFRESVGLVFNAAILGAIVTDN